MSARSAIDALPSSIIHAIREDARHFPPHIQRRGRTYHAQHRVGPLEVDPARIGATVRGTRRYRTAWIWKGSNVDPQCTCPSGPVCKHAYALARAIDAQRHDGEAQVSAARRRELTARSAAVGREPFRGQRLAPGPPDREPAPAELADELARWARRHRDAPQQTLRVAAGLDLAGGTAPTVWIEARVDSARLRDAPRSAQQISQLAADVRREPGLLAPPQARLLRILAATIPGAVPLGANRFGLRASAIVRLLDSFSNSPLVRWDDAEAGGGRGGIAPGERLRLGDAVLDIVPVSSGGSMDLSIMLAARWPDGRLRPLDEIVHVPTDDDLHPSLLLVDGTFWCVGEEPPAHVIRRLTSGGGLPVPRAGREHFLGLLASTFNNVADALAPHMRVHPARPVITLDLGTDDWLHVRLFAHTGDDDWRPGSSTPGVVAFELGPEAEWQRLDPADAVPEADLDRAAMGGDPGAVPPAAQMASPAGDPGRSPAPATTDDIAPAGDDPVWVEVPDPRLVEPAREWLRLLPLAPRGRPFGSQNTDPARERGAWLRLTLRRLETFADAWAQRPREVTFLGNERMRTLFGERRVVRPRLSVTSSGVDWFAVSADWETEGRALTEAELAKLRASGKRFVRLGSGWAAREWVEAYDAGAALLADLGLEPGAGAQRLTVAQLAQARPESLALLDEIDCGGRARRDLERLRERVREFTGLPRVELPSRLRATLRPYQREGLDFLAFVTGLGLGAVLADDMGLGKTVQALAWIEWLREREPRGGPVLVVCPASVVHNWQREAERFTPDLRVLALESGAARYALRREVPHHDVVITNYALLRRDLEHWRSVPLRAAILDEAQNIKNPATAMSRAVRELDAKHRLALTGTPIENRALDLWSIMQFVNPGYLGPRRTFVARYDRPDAAAHARRLLAARLRPVLLRRLKEDVARDLPDRIEEPRECEMTPGQRKLYLAELMRGRATVERLAESAEGLTRHKLEVLAALTRLRQICCHPALAGGREELGSGKFHALFEILEPLLAEGRKVLVFSQFVKCLDLLAAEMRRRGTRYHVLTGATTRREQVVGAFEGDPEPCVFLISLKAGGTGLNLTAAQYVVLFDPWWNPAVEAQAIDRTHRIGQTRTVIAYRMLAAGTIEEKIWELQRRKQALIADVLGEDGFARSLTKDDLDYLFA